MSFAELGIARGANIPEHGRLRGLEVGNPHPQYALADHDHDEDYSGADHTHDEVEQAGTEDFTYTAATSASGSVNFPTAFAAAPVVTLTLVIGSNHDWNINLQGTATTGFTWRAFQNAGVSLSGTGTIHWHARPAT